MRARKQPTVAKKSPAAERQETFEELLGELARGLSLLVRRELELAAAQNRPHLRHLAGEVAVAIAAGAALLLAMVALSWAAVQGLAAAMPSWAASLVVGAVWAVVAASLARLDHPRRLLGRLAQERSEQALEAAGGKRDEAEQAVFAVAERLGSSVARETVEREVEAGLSETEHLAEDAEDEAEDLLRELAVALLAPGRAGISLLERIVGRQSPPR